MTAGPGRRRAMLILLFVIFAAPFAGAWLLVNFTNVGRTENRSHGELLQPPRPLPDIALRDPSAPARTGHLHGKWTLLVAAAANCGRMCADNLYRMRQIRLAAGADAERVQRLLVIYGGELDAAGRGALAQFPGQLVADGAAFDPADPGASFRLAPGEDVVGAARLYLVDPLGNLILAYRPDSDPVGVIADLRRLLRYSHIG